MRLIFTECIPKAIARYLNHFPLQSAKRSKKKDAPFKDILV